MTFVDDTTTNWKRVAGHSVCLVYSDGGKWRRIAEAVKVGEVSLFIFRDSDRTWTIARGDERSHVHHVTSIASVHVARVICKQAFGVKGERRTDYDW